MNLDTYMNALRGRTAAVLGVGVSNRPLIELLTNHGCAVTARDKKTDLGTFGAELEARGVTLRLGEDYLEDLTEDVIFRTPGLRPDLPPMAAAVFRYAWNCSSSLGSSFLPIYKNSLLNKPMPPASFSST